MDKLSLTMYTEIDIMCMLILLYIAKKSFHKAERRESWRFFQWSIYFILLFIASDLLWQWMESHILPGTMASAYLVNCGYFIFSIAGTASWFFYTESGLETGFINRRRFMLLFFVPLTATVVFLALNNSTRWLFYIDARGIYHRGSLNILSFLIPCFYLIVSMIHSVSKALKKENYARKDNYLNLAAFALTTTIPCIIHMFVPGTPLPCIGLTAAIMLVYINSQEMLVSLDPLTKLNNRYQMIRFLSNKMGRATGENALYLLIIDLDNFKRVNDIYGHVEGDNALVNMASVLKMAAAAFGCFVSRYGGDEFILIHETDSETEIDDICNYIQKKLDEINRLSDKDYTMRVSIGKAKYHNEIKYIPEFIAMADKALYKVKRKRKSDPQSQTFL